MMAGLMTPASHPSQLVLSCLELRLYHLQDVVRILLFKNFSISVPSKNRIKYLSLGADPYLPSRQIESFLRVFNNLLR